MHILTDHSPFSLPCLSGRSVMCAREGHHAFGLTQKRPNAFAAAAPDSAGTNRYGLVKFSLVHTLSGPEEFTQKVLDKTDNTSISSMDVYLLNGKTYIPTLL